MSLRKDQLRLMIVFVAVLKLAAPAIARDMDILPGTSNRPGHVRSAAQNKDMPSTTPEFDPAIPDGMTMDEVFEFSETPPPKDFPQTILDDRLYIFTLLEQVEHRFATQDDTADHLGWEAQGWVGDDFNKFWWKNEGEAVFDGDDEGEMETDLLYSRLITPFWNFQAGVQYANEWDRRDYDDRWSGVIGLQGLAPYKFELDNVLYISEDADFTLEFEAEYDIRITQRLVLQPRAELGVAFQDIPERDLGAGFTETNLDLRLRYEIKREFAPYIGIRYQTLLGETHNIAEKMGEDADQIYLLAGFRFAF